MSRRVGSSAVAALAVALALTSSARGGEAPGSIVKNARFDDRRENGLPAEWNGGDPARASVVEEAGERFLRIAHVTTATTNLNQRFAVDARWTSIRVSVRIRARAVVKGPEGWNSGCLQYVFTDAAGQHVGGWDKRLVERDQDWAVLTDEVPVPAGAAQLGVECAAFNCSGTFDFDDVVVVPALAGELPAGERAGWGEEPVERLSAARGRICLNGLWKFEPAAANAAREPAGGWGYIRVPGTWQPVSSLPGMVVRGVGEAWSGFDGETLARAWYERPIRIPPEWKGRSVVLELARVSTDATVYVDGVSCGTVDWPYGEVDLTAALAGKSEATLRVLVVAVQNAAEVLNARGVGQNTAVKARLDSRGIIGEVFLHARPRGPRVGDVFVQTSVRRKEIALDVELADVARSETVNLVARVLDASGVEARRFEADEPVFVRERQTLRLAWQWDDPKLWEFLQPNLYTLQLAARGAGLDDEYPVSFGFREFWIEGRSCLLNGTPFRMRPTSSFGEGIYGQNNGTVAGADAAFDALAAAGFNVFEMWPWDHDVRGCYGFRELLCERADLKGFPVIAPALSAGEYIFTWRGPNWTEPGVKERWEARMAAELRRYRNHPSVIFWATTANCFGHGEDQDPRRVGRSLVDSVWKNEDEDWWAHQMRGREVEEAIKRHDPTRAVMFHQGGPLGEICALNNYLCMIPLQEREEWLSDWATGGDMPYMAVEFGTPLHVTMNRGRHGFGPSQASEPWMTEFGAIYFGSQAYRKEPASYRSQIASRFVKEQDYLGWQGDTSLEHAWAFQEIQRLFITNTWRSWRAMGLTGGLVPWSDGHGWGARDNTPVPLGPFVPGMRGAYMKTLPRHVMKMFQKEGGEFLPGGEALVASNNATNAFIAAARRDGDIAAFTAKDHAFVPASHVEKSVVVVNDTRGRAGYSAQWEVRVGGRTVFYANDAGTLDVGETAFVPLRFRTPPSIAGEKVDCEIVLGARVANRSHADRFAFRVHAPPAAPQLAPVAVFDPEGATQKLLDELRVPTRAWDGHAAPLVVVGRNALSAGGRPPAELETYVERGGRLLVFAQDPAWLRGETGLRVAEAISRRVFPVDAAHPVVAGLDAEDLRDWSGSGTLVDPRPVYGKDVSRYNGAPFWGWRWGSRGSVSSAPVEKPHRSGWRPVLECEFDLAYTPLMELDAGRGRAFLCTLDLEGRAGDPAARRLATQLVAYAAACPLAPRAERVVYVGDDAGEAMLQSLGLRHTRADRIDTRAELLVVGRRASLDGLDAYVRAGGRAFVLARDGDSTAFGARLEKRTAFGGSLEVPAWDEARGLSGSDLRWRTESAATLLAGGDGVEVGASGLVGRVRLGRGVAVISQIDPAALDADAKTYFRFTRWRMTRATSQILANLGASFTADRRFLRPESTARFRVPLAGGWKARRTLDAGAQSAPGAIKDRGMTDEVRRLMAANVDDASWATYEAPAMWDGFAKTDGEAVFRRVVEIPAHLAGEDLVLHLGPVDDFDDTYFNGKPVGSTDVRTQNFWSHPRVYAIPGRLVKEGRNVIAVRCFDHFGGGGFGGQAFQMMLAIADEAKHLPPSPYHADYRTDFERGDDPYRYFRW